MSESVEPGAAAHHRTQPGGNGFGGSNDEREQALNQILTETDGFDHADLTDALEHAIVGMLTPGADPVRKVSIIPRGQSLGGTFSAPEANQFNYAREYLLGRIRVALGGRVAEELVLGDITTGAESDNKAADVMAYARFRGDKGPSWTSA